MRLLSKTLSRHILLNKTRRLSGESGYCLVVPSVVLIKTQEVWMCETYRESKLKDH